jgi:hypothetical protein
MSQPTCFSVMGERCSGTKHLINLIILNFNLTYDIAFRGKHFYGFADYSKNSDNKLYIGIVRDPTQWIGSFFKEKHQVCPENRDDLTKFVTNEWWSYYDNKEGHYDYHYGKEIMEDRNMHTNNRYKNLFELRMVKAKYLLDEMPNKVKYFILLRYEDILTKPYETFMQISRLINIPLPAKDVIGCDPSYIPNIYTLPSDILDIIDKNLDKDTEKRLGYTQYSN